MNDEAAPTLGDLRKGQHQPLKPGVIQMRTATATHRCTPERPCSDPLEPHCPPVDAAAPDVYPVGLFRDIRNTWNRLRAPGKRGRRAAIRTFFRWFGRSWRRRSYWNGYLAETDTGWRAGHGWTPRRARHDLAYHLTVEAPNGA